MNVLLIFWIVVAIFLGIVELITVDLVTIWFCFGCIGAAVACRYHAPFWLQVITCIVISVIAIIITRPLTKKILRGNIEKTNSDRLIGKQALVTKTIQPDARGEVKIGGEYWTAIDIDNDFIEQGSHVEVLAIEGVKLVVKKI